MGISSSRGVSGLFQHALALDFLVFLYEAEGLSHEYIPELGACHQSFLT